MRKTGGVSPIKNVVKKVVEGLLDEAVSKKDLKDLLDKAWLKAAGKKAAKHARIASLRKSKLIVEVSESGWLYQLNLKKQEILGELNKKMGDEKIEEIRFRIGDFSEVA